jgi:hypothetical protein
MLKRLLCVTGILALSGCGVGEYFDQHPANVRDMSDDQGAVGAPASSESEIAPMMATTPQAAGAASPVPLQNSPASAEPAGPSAGAASQGAVQAQERAPSVASSAEQAAPSPVAPQSATEQTSGSEDCNTVAAARAADAAANGYGDDLQQVVHDKTYADCMAWNAAHR